MALPRQGQRAAYFGTQRITVASPGKLDVGSVPVYHDYALMKVLYMLRHNDKTTRVHAFTSKDSLDFSDLRGTDFIYIVGHGDSGGLYELGRNAEKNSDRLVEILTDDGNLKKKRKGKQIDIVLLSCRAGSDRDRPGGGLHKVLARKLYNKLGHAVDVVVFGAKGFTFGSVRTFTDQQNEVCIEGLPWWMEYGNSSGINLSQAEQITSEREGQEITYASKRKEIEKFLKRSQELEKKMKEFINGLKSNEVNNALNEIQDSSNSDYWLALIWLQEQHYKNARKNPGTSAREDDEGEPSRGSNLGFDMWYPSLDEAYVFADGKRITDGDVASILAQVTWPSGDRRTSIK